VIFESHYGGGSVDVVVDDDVPDCPTSDPRE
jgi:hypothetical protein